MPAALDGVRVLELADGWSAAALAGRLLAELGAEVVKRERPSGDSLRHDGSRAADGQPIAWHLAAAGKRSVVTAAGDGRRAMEALLGWTDIVLADVAGLVALASCEIPVQALPRAAPHVVACAITPFGLTGPLASWTAGELTLQAASGVMATTGAPHRPPTRAGVPLGAHVGALLATTAVLAALRTREAGSPGQVIDLSLHDGLVSCLGTFLPSYFVTGRPPGRIGNRHPMVVPWNAYACGDGWVVICAANERLWGALTEAIGRDDVRGDGRYATLTTRLAHVEEIDALVAAFTGARTMAEVLAIMDAAGVPAGPIATLPDVLASPHFAARRLRVDVPGSGGRIVPAVGPLFKMTASPGFVSRGAPALGEATDELLTAAEQFRRPATPGAARVDALRVLEMAAFTAGPAAVRLLASLGADVVKIETPRGEAARHLPPFLGGDGYLFHINNTDKRSVALDVATADGRRAVLALARHADAFVENFAPGTTRAWGVGPDALLEEHQGLVYCSITGFGDGPLGSRAAFDTVVQGLAGVMALTGWADDPPVKIGLSIADLLGACLAPAAVLAALRYRDRTGRGQHLDVSLYDVMAWTTASAWPAVLAGQAAPARDGNRHPGLAPHDVYRAGDGREVAIEVVGDAAWTRLARVLGRPELGVDPRYATAGARRLHADELDAVVASWIGRRRADEAVAVCQEAGVAAAPVWTVGEVAEHPHLRDRDMIVTREHAVAGPVRLLGTPLRLTEPPSGVRRAAPALGAHTADILGKAPAGAVGAAGGPLASAQPEDDPLSEHAGRSDGGRGGGQAVSRRIIDAG